MMQIAGQILSIFCTVLGICFGAYHVAILIRGLRRPMPSIPHHDEAKRLAVVIPARNEERVIEPLIDSLKAQKYPADKYAIFVAVNNCTDNTAAVAEQAGARVLQIGGTIRGKGDVLKKAFDQIRALGEGYDGYIVFDADNVVDERFFSAASDALCAGSEIAQSCRDSKNPADNWVAGSTSVFFWFMSCLYNRARSALGMSVPLNGTGIVFSERLLARIGYEADSLTEDLEYTGICALHGARIDYIESAVTYDEQPTRLRDSCIQRWRWGAGTRQCLCRYWRSLWRRRQNANCRDILIQYSGILLQGIGLVPTLIALAEWLLSGRWRNPGEWAFCGIALVALSAGMVLIGAICVLIIAHRMGKTRALGRSTWCMMWFFMVSWVPSNLLALFGPAPRWKIIEHKSVKRVSELMEA